MSLRHVFRTVAVTGAATIAGGVLMLGIGAGPAGASTLTSSDGNTTLSTQGTVSSGPYSSGQVIDLAVAANNTMSTAGLAGASPPAPTTGNFIIEECTDPGGLVANLPTTQAGCEAATLESTGKTADGSIKASVLGGFTVYDLPDPGTLGSPTMTGSCDVAPNQCVIGIFAANPASANGFSFPHLFSAPFQVTVGDGSDVGDNPGDGTPEVPLAIGLPLAGVALISGWAIRNRRRQRAA